MKIDKVFVKDNCSFSTYITEWSEKNKLEVATFEFNIDDDLEPEGLLLINENQDVSREVDEIHSFFDNRNLPTQKIDINGTLQVAINSYKMWLDSNKCKQILILGSDDLLKNENLDRFFDKIDKSDILSAFQ